jgi:hypothetical protein
MALRITRRESNEVDILDLEGRLVLGDEVSVDKRPSLAGREKVCPKPGRRNFHG